MLQNPRDHHWEFRKMDRGKKLKLFFFLVQLMCANSFQCPRCHLLRYKKLLSTFFFPFLLLIFRCLVSLFPHCHHETVWWCCYYRKVVTPWNLYIPKQYWVHAYGSLAPWVLRVVTILFMSFITRCTMIACRLPLILSEVLFVIHCW